METSATRLVQTELRWYSCGAARNTGCGGVFRNCRGFASGSYVMPIGIENAITAEISGFLQGVELVEVKIWFPL